MTDIKFCGLRRPEDVEYANSVGPQYVGFVFWPQSRRCVTVDQAVALADRVSEDIVTVGVFLDAPVEDVFAAAESGCIDMVQLHGNESERYVRMVRNMTSLPIIRAFTVKGEEDLERALSTEADYVMLDSGAGSGKTFDWSVIGDLGRPYFLAGGLNPGNVAEAVGRYRPFAVDTSSGIETDGCKDLSKMTAFKNAVDEADKHISQ